jgi:hypothetical protein
MIGTHIFLARRLQSTSKLLAGLSSDKRCASLARAPIQFRASPKRLLGRNPTRAHPILRQTNSDMELMSKKQFCQRRLPISLLAAMLAREEVVRRLLSVRLPPNQLHVLLGGGFEMFFAEITTDPHRCHSDFCRITARRKNGDHVLIYGQTKRHAFAIKRILMKLARSFRVIPMADLADFIGLQGINATNDELIDCLSAVPDPYAEVDRSAAVIAWKRDWNICERVRAQDPSYKHLIAVSANAEDWMTFWRCNCPSPAMRDHLARELEEGRALKSENRRRLQQRGLLNGTAT